VEAVEENEKREDLFDFNDRRLCLGDCLYNTGISRNLYSLLRQRFYDVDVLGIAHMYAGYVIGGCLFFIDVDGERCIVKGRRTLS
jgi:hypothetical protein